MKGKPSSVFGSGFDAVPTGCRNQDVVTRLEVDRSGILENEGRPPRRQQHPLGPVLLVPKPRGRSCPERHDPLEPQRSRFEENFSLLRAGIAGDESEEITRFQWSGRHAGVLYADRRCGYLHEPASIRRWEGWFLYCTAESRAGAVSPRLSAAALSTSALNQARARSSPPLRR